MTRAAGVVAVAALAAASMAHVGSPNTFFTGDAGSYPVHVTVRLPGVIPGLAQIVIRLPGVPAGDVRAVSAQAVHWNVGLDGAPPPDPALPVPGDPELYSADLWFMAPTSYRVIVAVDGTRGHGTAVVPVVALATEERPMNPNLGTLLSALGVFLFVGLVTIVGAAVRESVLPPGAAPDATRRRRSRAAIAASALFLALIVWGGARWWGAEARSYSESVLYRPFNAVATTGVENGARRLTLAIKDPRWPSVPSTLSRYNALMPDHGKLMHMFLVREPAQDVFAHVHPVPRSPAGETFDVKLPAFPAGRYRVFGDIVHESGYAQTLVATADVPADSAGAASAGDPDDSWYEAPAVPEAPEAVFRHADGVTVTWSRGQEPLVAGQDRLLTFTARGPDGSPATLEPYMGMLGHVAVGRDDGSVFAHLHPSGSISMAALQRFGGESHAGHTQHGESRLEIPYAFAKPGRYRIWVQMKRAGRVFTSAFDAAVLASTQ